MPVQMRVESAFALWQPYFMRTYCRGWKVAKMVPSRKREEEVKEVNEVTGPNE